jgi:hypothetical protein
VAGFCILMARPQHYGSPARGAQCPPIEEKRTSEWTRATAIEVCIPFPVSQQVFPETLLKIPCSES